MYYVYILRSKIADRFYTGKTADLERRLNEHNIGHTYYSKRYRPWTIVYTEICKTADDATKRERYLKSAAGRRWIKKQIELEA